MKKLLSLLLLLVSSIVASGQKDTIEGLEQRIQKIDNELGNLSNYSLRGGAGAVGYRSSHYKTADNEEWIHVPLASEQLIDQIVLVPVLWRDSKSGLQSDGFPEEFEIRAGRQGDSKGQVIAQFKADRADLPRIAPLLVPCAPIAASWVRIIVTKLGSRVWDDKYILQLSKIMIFSGKENLALNQKITTPTSTYNLGSAWRPQHLVDGFLPYLINSTKGQQSSAYFSNRGVEKQASLALDLGKNTPINRVHIHSPDLSDTIPQPYIDGFGIPEKFILEGALQPDFSDATTLANYELESIYNTGPTLKFRFPETTCRYFRVNAIRLGKETQGTKERTLLGIAEVEVFSKGINVALGKTISPSYQENNKHHSLSQLTDGNNFYGQILDTREWMGELAKRHDLQTQRPLIESRLQTLYTAQKQKLRLMQRLSAVLLATILISVLIYRNLRQRTIYRVQNRIAADLHDGVGANLYAIGLLGDLAKEEVDSLRNKEEMNELIEIVDEIRTASKKTGEAAYTCTNMLQSPETYSNLLGEMKRISGSLLSDLDHHFSVAGEAEIQQIRKTARLNLYLFYKECLTNIIKHSGATKAHTQIKGNKRSVQLIVTDNGCGINPSHKQKPPKSLKRRALLFSAKLAVTTPPDGGTSISLTYRRRWIKLKK